MSYKLVLKKYIVPAIILLLASNCARVASPPGGPRDETPPKIIKSKPENRTVNFSGNKIEIAFDEYIKLKDINQLITSPPTDPKPEVRLKGMGIEIKLSDSLEENTTYTLNFGDAITDNNEGNPIENFQFVFSTGPKLDSLSIAGRVWDAFDQTIPEDVYILLYSDLEDSALYNTIPLYLTKATEDGSFIVNNLKDGSYNLFALKDDNKNYKYDPPEKMAFMDSVFILNPATAFYIPADTILSDTAYTDSLSQMATGDSLPLTERDSITAPALIADSLLLASADSLLLAEADSNQVPEGFLSFRLFEETISNQYISSSSRFFRHNILLIFNEALIEDPAIEIIDSLSYSNWFIPERYVVGDSLGLWITDTTVANIESIRLSVKYALKGEKEGSFATDTLSLRFAEKKGSGTGRSGKGSRSNKSNVPVKEEIKKEAEKLKAEFTTGNGSKMNLNGILSCGFGTPLSTYDTSKIELISIVDSTESIVPYSLIFNKEKFRSLKISASWIEKTAYRLEVLPGAFTDIYSVVNDSLEYSFTSRAQDEYSRIMLKMEDIKEPLIIQLMDSKGEKVLRSNRISGDTTLDYSYLEPTTYKLKAIQDNNDNGKWDTGSWLERKQPEKVGFYQEEMTLRANWEFEKSWSPEFE